MCVCVYICIYVYEALSHLAEMYSDVNICKMMRKYLVPKISNSLSHLIIMLSDMLI